MLNQSPKPVWKVRYEMAMVSNTITVLLGGLVMVLFITIITTHLTMHDIASWGNEVLGPGFIGLMLLLSFVALYGVCRSEVQLRQGRYEKAWLEAGYQAANGITTLALTYTLLGISLGIGTLAEQSLTPETIQEVTKALTAKFALAFMTTVIGLPLSAFLRAILAITNARIDTQSEIRKEKENAFNPV